MTIVRRALPVMAAACGVCAFSAAAFGAQPPPAKAPGRVVFSVNGGVVSNDADSGGARAAVALPDGGAVIAGNGGTGRGFHAYVAEINADGSLSHAFGGGPGVAMLPGFTVDQILREPDGSLIVAGEGASVSRTQFPPIVLAHVSADGSLDSSFGTHGIATLSIQSSCGDCAAVSILPGGDLVVTGNTGNLPSNPAQNPQATADTQWVVARLTPNGALDPSFGAAGIVTLLPSESYGAVVATLADGDIVAVGSLTTAAGPASLLTRLQPSGALDPTFNGGILVAVPGIAASGMIADADGTVVVDATSDIVRYTAAGGPDPSFGSAGVAPITGFVDPTLPFPLAQKAIQQTGILPVAGDSAVLYNVGNGGVVLGERLTPAGGIDPTFDGASAQRVELGFGGGGSGFVTSVRPRPLPPLVQDSTDIRGSIVERSDGSFLAINGVSVIQPTGEGEGRSIFDFAVAGLTPTFTVDPSFGGPASPLYVKLRVITQRASTAHTRHGIRVELTQDEPGLTRVVIKAHGRVVAQNVLPAFGHGEMTIPVELTTYGNQLLRDHKTIKVTATATGRDLLTNTATSTASGTLR
ncbi:MAG TPA: hypothetical protein VG165_03385 [Solirubrobacteraceae bacterium]|nr:hypothetical protein [Solirubrobacteraceae bacterium]